MDDIIKYLEALEAAEARGEEEFLCPICGGQAHWGRSQINGHICSRCEQCGIGLIE